MYAKFNLWKQPAANYREPRTWGGTAVLTGGLRLDRMMQLKHGTLFAEETSSSNVVVNRVADAVVNLLGSGDYPAKQSDKAAVSS